jgi:hypothetical protein
LPACAAGTAATAATTVAMTTRYDVSRFMFASFAS